MKHGSLFSGIGGFDLAAHWAGWENIFQVEKDEKCQRRLKQNFPNVKRFTDIKEFDGNQFRGTIDVISGGPPCQPASLAGKREGEKDYRWLWPEAIRVFGEVRPRVGVFENPDDLLTLDDGEPFERICCSLENFSYKVETYGLPAACVGAWHQRDRIWIIAYSDSFGRHDEQKKSDNLYITKSGTVRLRNKAGTSSNAGLANTLRFLPTLTHRDYRGQHKENSEAFNQRLKHPRGVSLVEHLQRLGDIGKLNPEWCEWFMGYPKGWTELRD